MHTASVQDYPISSFSLNQLQLLDPHSTPPVGKQTSVITRTPSLSTAAHHP